MDDNWPVDTATTSVQDVSDGAFIFWLECECPTLVPEGEKGRLHLQRQLGGKPPKTCASCGAALVNKAPEKKLGWWAHQ